MILCHIITNTVILRESTCSLSTPGIGTPSVLLKEAVRYFFFFAEFIFSLLSYISRLILGFILLSITFSVLTQSVHEIYTSMPTESMNSLMLFLCRCITRFLQTHITSIRNRNFFGKHVFITLV